MVPLPRSDTPSLRVLHLFGRDNAPNRTRSDTPSLRVLHLFSNYRWTGPAEPAVNLCVALSRLGVDVMLAAGADPRVDAEGVRGMARSRGLTVLADLRLGKHRHPLWNPLDAWRLRRLLRQLKPDVLHCHMDNDHAIATAAVRGLDIPVVRSSYYGEGMPADRRHRELLRHTSRVLEPSLAALEADRARFGLPPDRLTRIDPAVDTKRFDPCRVNRDAARARMGLSPETVAVGIVARMQPYRHFEDLFDALSLVVRKDLPLRLVVIGRGTRQESVGFEAVRSRNLERWVLFPGYQRGDDYVAALSALDIGVLLVPGTDGTCRAVREMMAMGLPMVVANRGMLAELVTHESDGLVCPGTPESLAEALTRLVTAPDLRAIMGSRARHAALERFSLDGQARRVRSVYLALLGREATTA